MPYYEGLIEDMVVQALPDTIGRGISELNMYDSAGRLSTNTGAERVSQCISAILRTPIGSRLKNPEFGSYVYREIMEPNDFTFRTMVERYALDAIAKLEPRAEDVSVYIDTESFETIAKILVTFKVKGTNSTETLTYMMKRRLSEAT